MTSRPSWLKFGEFLWWFFSVVQNLAVGYASWTVPISIGTVSPHGLSTGQRAILAGIQGNTAANGDQTINVTDTTHFTLNGSSGNGNCVGGTGTCSGGGMAYYDAYTAQAAQTAARGSQGLLIHRRSDQDVGTSHFLQSRFSHRWTNRYKCTDYRWPSRKQMFASARGGLRSQAPL
jgi:hypothetical protein